jgi:hypothetical protein
LADFADESEVYTYLSHRLSEKGLKILGKRVGAGRLSPDIDILAEREGVRIGFEVKYFRAPSRFYEGLDEALALLAHGLDEVYLIHVFDSSTGEQAHEMAQKAATLVRLTPIGYMVMVGRSEPEVLVEARGNPLKGGPEGAAPQSGT